MRSSEIHHSPDSRQIIENAFLMEKIGNLFSSKHGKRFSISSERPIGEIEAFIRQRIDWLSSQLGEKIAVSIKSKEENVPGTYKIYIRLI